jgi:hypothetical protein
MDTEALPWASLPRYVYSTPTSYGADMKARTSTSFQTELAPTTNLLFQILSTISGCNLNQRERVEKIVTCANILNVSIQIVLLVGEAIGHVICESMVRKGLVVLSMVAERCFTGWTNAWIIRERCIR